MTIKTATGKEFECEFAGAAGEYAIITFTNMDMATVMKTFSDPDELPFEGFEPYTAIANVVNEPIGIKLILKEST